MDATPVENLFITEYMLHAPGEYVKLYLYLLMQCYHPRDGLTLAQAAKDLGMPDEEAMKGMKYWEREGLARQVGDNPPVFQMRSPRQIAFEKKSDPGQQVYDSHFTEEVYRILGNDAVNYQDLRRIYDWVDVLELPEEIVLMLLQNEMKENKKLYMPVAERHAREWAAMQVRTVEEVEKILSLGQKQRKELKALLQRLGQMRNPSEDEKTLYIKWTREWGFTPQAIQEACRATVSGTPNLAYLDGILLRLHDQGCQDQEQVRKALSQNRSVRDFARQVLQGLGRTGVVPTEEDIALVREWMDNGYPDEYVMLAVRASHRRIGGESFEAVNEQIRRWQDKGLRDEEAVRAQAMLTREKNEFLRDMYAKAGSDRQRPSEQDRERLDKWEAAGFSREVILLAAGYAFESPGKANALPKILENWQKQGIFTLEEARQEHDRHRLEASGTPSESRPAEYTRHTDEERQAAIGAATVDLDGEV